MRDGPNLPAFVAIGESRQTDLDAAVDEALAQIAATPLRFLLAFLPAHLDAAAVAAKLEAALDGVPAFGCTTAGQITQAGYDDATLLLLGFPKAYFRCASLLLEDLTPDRAMIFGAAAQRLAQSFGRTPGWNRLALFFSDGLCKQEDLMVSTLDAALGSVPIFGGSAGDAMTFEQTRVLHGGQAHQGSAVMLLIETSLAFQGLAFDHFQPGEAQLIITEADPDERLVYEINGAPAAPEYARLVGRPVAELGHDVFAEHPMLLRQGAKHYARAISGVTDAQALSFLAAIDDGLILTLGEARGPIEALGSGLDVQAESGRPPDFILGFDCFLRRLEFEQKQMRGVVSEILSAHNVLGFNTFGEQQSGLHMNHTFVGVAFFDPVDRELI